MSSLFRFQELQASASRNSEALEQLTKVVSEQQRLLNRMLQKLEKFQDSPGDVNRSGLEERVNDVEKMMAWGTPRDCHDVTKLGKT